MEETQVQHIMNDPQFQQMVKRKTRLGTVFSIITLFIYFGYLLLIGFNKSLFAIPVATGATATYGMYAGLLIMWFTVIITGIYVHKANGEFDSLTKKVIADTTSNKI